MKRDLLFLAHRVPYPPDRGDKIRSYHVLRYLAARYRVHLVAFADDAREQEGAAALRPYLASYTIVPRRKSRARAVVEALASGRPVSLTAFEDAALASAVAQVLARDVGMIYVFSGQMAQYLPTLSEHRIVMDFVDLDSAKFAAYADAARGPKAWIMHREARLLGAFERAVAARIDVSVFVSEAEAAPFRATVPEAAVAVIENGIDAACYDPTLDHTEVAAAAPLIVFTGQMDYPPNEEAVRWFAQAILPQVRRAHPTACFAVVGRAPGVGVRALAALEGVTVTGEVADVRPWLAAAACVVAPLRLARGIQNKVLEAMAMARPVVASTAAAQGIDHGGTIAVGSMAGEIAALVDAVLADPIAAAARGAAARARVLARYAWPARLAGLDAMLGDAAPAVRDAA